MVAQPNPARSMTTMGAYRHSSTRRWLTAIAGVAVLAPATTGCAATDASSTPTATIARATAAHTPATVSGETRFGEGRNGTIVFYGPDLGDEGTLEFTNGGTYDIPLSVQLKPGAVNAGRDVTISVSRSSGPYPLQCRQAPSVPLLDNVGQVNLRCTGTFGTDGQHGADETLTVLVHQVNSDGKRRLLADASLHLAVTTSTPAPPAALGPGSERTTRLPNGATVAATVTGTGPYLTAGTSHSLTWAFTYDGPGAAQATVTASDLAGRKIPLTCTDTTVTAGQAAQAECRITLTDPRDIRLTATWTLPDGTSHTQDLTGVIPVTW